ncbi:hypothetical protein AWB78_04049 [Caballeronia calidae]|uniref:Uncharacterized protein n=1 Tax=Caballeronia calidae TaxID=1777139 RepID=A0A158CKG4_9BURK|nr:hypothetical protein AWB78_04049 [Caballeronia calidae]
MVPHLNCGIMLFENADLDRTAGERLNNAVQFNSVSFGGIDLRRHAFVRADCRHLVDQCWTRLQRQRPT